MPQVKRRKSMQVRDNRTLDISGWLGYSIVNDGTVSAAVDLRRLDQNGDFTCKESDGIPFAEGENLSIVFDEAGNGTKLLTIDYTIIECC